jgi:hypothetical protein
MLTIESQEELTLSERKQSIKQSEVTSISTASGLPMADAPPLVDLVYSGVGIDVTGQEDLEAQPTRTLESPRSLEIVSQSIRFAPDGTQYVTVVVSFETVDGANDYDFRISRV